MMSRDTVCDLCDRVPGDEVDSRRCEDCGGVICEEHSGVHDPEDHIGVDDADDVAELLDDR
jgi:hypothetical protein